MHRDLSLPTVALSSALLIPVIFSFHRLRTLPTFSSRGIFLFYLTGCSGLVVVGDLFSFFVLYQLMIMAAYMLIAVKDQYYASITYMLFGAVSSAFFLAGIVLLYASGAYSLLGFGLPCGARPCSCRSRRPSSSQPSSLPDPYSVQ